MGVFDKASLALVPDGIKDGKLYSIKPTDGSGDFTFERGANLAATRVDENGLIEKGRENFVAFSNVFDTNKTPFNVTVSSGEAGYDGTNNAWKLIKGSSSGDYLRWTESGSLGTAVFTYSIYVKAGSLSYFVIWTTGGNQAYFELTGNGSVTYTQGSALVDSKIESVGNGWYRCSLTAYFNNSEVRFYPTTDGTPGVGGGTSGDFVYIQNFQAEYGLVATEYVDKVDYVTGGLAGVLENLPRIDYTGGTPSLLLEPQRTNLIANSEYLGEVLTGNRMAINDVVDTSPEGVVNASKLVPDTTPNQTHQSDTGNYGSFVSGDKITISMFAKADGFDGILLRFRDSSGAFTTNRMAIFDLNRGRWENLSMDGTTGVMTGEVGMEDYGNGWYRCFATATADASGDVDIRIPVVDVTAQDTYDETFTGDSTSGVLIYGLQLEQGSYPTSYIPTYGAIATRGDDFFDSSADFTSFFGNNQGTIYIETAKRLFEDETDNEDFIGVRENSSGNYWRIIGQDQIIFVQSIGWGSTFIHYPYNNNPTKYLFKWDGSNTSFYVDGSLIGSATQTATFSPNAFGRSGNGVSAKSQELLKQFILFPTALSDAECITLTT